MTAKAWKRQASGKATGSRNATGDYRPAEIEPSSLGSILRDGHENQGRESGTGVFVIFLRKTLPAAVRFVDRKPLFRARLFPVNARRSGSANILAVFDE